MGGQKWRMKNMSNAASQKRSALVLFSGGQDSTVCLAWALERFGSVETVGFSYGQRHDVELVARGNVRKALARSFETWRSRLGADHVLDLAELGRISDTALTRETEIEIADTGLPTTFVPGRNLIFLSYAAAVAYRRGITTLIGGMCETDYSGYPDCRRATIDAMAQALSLGMDQRFDILTPLMNLDKCATWKLAHDLGGEKLLEIIIEDTHTCYSGERMQRHAWGYGCGECPACKLRAKGWMEWQKKQTPVES